MARHSSLVVLLVTLLGSPLRADLVADAQVMIRAKDFAGAAAVLTSGDLSPEAMLLLASLYRTGKGVARDEVQARSLTLAAAQAGLAEAQYALARMDMDGIARTPIWSPRGRGPRLRQCRATTRPRNFW
jgi:TPR repeat protein